MHVATKLQCDQEGHVCCDVLQSFTYWLHVSMVGVACKGLWCMWLERYQQIYG